MAVLLPSWADEVESVLRKAERYRDMTPEERGAHMAAACRANAALLRNRADAERVLAWVDPPPASTVAALARLRALVVAGQRMNACGKDLVDLEHLVAVHGDKRDRGFVRQRIVDMMGADDERVVAWDRIVSRFAAQT